MILQIVFAFYIAGIGQNSAIFSSVISSIEDMAYKSGFTVTISKSNDQFEKETKIAHTFFTNRVNGIIISIAMETMQCDHLKLFPAKNTPLVFFDRVVDEIDAHRLMILNERILQQNTSLNRGPNKLPILAAR
jgi:DNA-binding LacI/PurR family transcriptional regulator